MTRTDGSALPLREACIGEALAIIEQQGLEHLSLREVARRLGVSHQAPYKHYPSRDHLLAEIVARTFTVFAAHLADRPRREDPFDDLGEIGRAYLGFALAHPLQYRLMFGIVLPDPDRHPEMMAKARDSFAILRDAIARLPRHAGRSGVEAAALCDRDALHVWATVHGFATILPSGAVTTLPLAPDTLLSLEAHVMMRLRQALED